jgi:hypothetical protein
MSFHTLFSPSSYYQRYLIGIALLLIGLPFSKFLMSSAQLFLLGNWLLYQNPVKNFRLFFKNKPALILSGIYIIHLLGILYSNDLKYGTDELRKKLPLLFLPIIASSSPVIKKEHLETLLKIFLATVFAATLVSLAVFLGITGKEIVDIRKISLFVSHIRFALMICFSFFIAVWFFIHTQKNSRYLYLFASVWMLFSLILLESLTGLAIIAITSFLILSYYIIKSSKKWLLYSYIAGILTVILLIAQQLLSIYKNVSEVHPIDFSLLETHSKKGEVYYHNVQNKEHENGNYIWIYIADQELINTWSKRSNLDLNAEDLKGNSLRHTLIRFLSSKGLRKDEEGVNALSEGEIRAIEKGIANVEYMESSSINDRIHQIMWEIYNYTQGNNPNGHSLTMRLEFWKAAYGIIKEHPIAGVGTGDVNAAFLEQYEKINSPLDPHNRLRAHNQYLEIAVALGITGLFLFLFFIFYPIWILKNNLSFFYVAFIIIALISMLSEDTLETQAGITFFAVFNTFLLIQGVFTKSINK